MDTEKIDFETAETESGIKYRVVPEDELQDGGSLDMFMSQVIWWKEGPSDEMTKVDDMDFGGLLMAVITIHEQWPHIQEHLMANNLEAGHLGNLLAYAVYRPIDSPLMLRFCERMFEMAGYVPPEPEEVADAPTGG